MSGVADIDNNLASDKNSQHIINHSTSYRLKSRSEISSLLNRLSNNHTLLSIRLAENDRTFGSMILEINSEKAYLVLDELYPRNELNSSLLNHSLSIETQLEGIEIHFTVKVDAIAEKDGLEYYRVSYPSYVYHHQRRASYRVNVGITDSLPIAFSTEDDVLLHAELRNISMEGVSARINSPNTQTLAVGDEIPTCIINIPDGRKIVASLEIARIDEGTSSKATRVGARFVRIAATDRLELSRLVAKLDRENIKKLKRLSDSN